MKGNVLRRTVFIFVLLFGAGQIFSGSVFAKESNVIKMGAVNCLSGPAALFGNMASKAQIGAIKEINDKGGIKIGAKKFRVKYIEYDDGSNNDKARAAAERLATVDKVPVVVNSLRSSGAIALQPVAEKYKIAMFTNGFSPKVNHADSYMFRTQPTTCMDSFLPLKYLYEDTKYRKIGILAEDGDWGEDVIELIRWWTKKFGGSCKVLGRFPFAEKDFHALITKTKLAVMKKEVDVVYVQSWASAMELFIRQAYETGLSRKVPLISGLGAIDYVSIANVTPQLEGWIGASLYGILNYFDKPEVARAFSKESIDIFKRYKKAELPMSGIALGSYTNVMMAASAIEKAGSTDPQKVRDALAGLTAQTMVGKMVFNDFGQPSLTMNVVKMVLKNGKIVPEILKREVVPAIISLPPTGEISVNVKK